MQPIINNNNNKYIRLSIKYINKYMYSKNITKNPNNKKLHHECVYDYEYI